MNTMSFYEFRSEHTGLGSRSYIFKENKILSLTNLFQQYILIYLNEKLNFYHHINYYTEKCSNAQDQKICFTNLFIDFKI